jgi:hypothetical protein
MALDVPYAPKSDTDFRTAANAAMATSGLMCRNKMCGHSTTLLVRASSWSAGPLKRDLRFPRPFSVSLSAPNDAKIC